MIVLALDLYRKARPSSRVPELMRTSRMGAVTIGLAALALALTGSGIIAMLFAVCTVFTSGMLVPVIGGFYKEKLGLTTFWSIDRLGWRCKFCSTN